MSSPNQDLESAVVARLKVNVPALVKVSAVAFPGSTETTTDSEAMVFYVGEKKIDSRPIAGSMHQTMAVEFGVVLHKRHTGGPTGDSRLGFAGAYELQKSVTSALLGFQPVITNAPNVYPCALEEVAIVETGSDSIEIVMSWSTQWEIAELIS